MATPPIFPLIASRLPDANAAFRNCIMISPQDLATLFPGKAPSPAYLEIQSQEGTRKTMFIVVEGHQAMKVGSLGLSILLRQSLGLSENSEARVRPYIPKNKPKEVLAAAHFEVNLIRDEKATISETKLLPIVKKSFLGHVLNVGELLCLDLEGVSVKLTVKALDVPADKSSKEDIVENAAFGIFMDFTNITFEASKNKKLTFQTAARKGMSFNYREMKIGGLDDEFNSIFRRAFVSRTFPPHLMEEMGRKHVKGMLLYGPPGTGKTLIARQIGKMLSTVEPIIVNGPEVMNKYVGASEENIRKLFVPAEMDYKQNKENADLHIIIFDEIDAICKARGSAGGGTGVHDTMVNQLLTKIDGVEPLPNILVIGMTNRKDLIDPALLRPGRLEVHIEIGLPNEAGRLQIFKIHTEKMSSHGYLAKDVNLEYLAEITKNYSGAEIEGLINAATSFALYGNVRISADNTVVSDFKPEDLQSIQVCMEDFTLALTEVPPAFGVSESDLQKYLPVSGSLIEWGTPYGKVISTVTTLRDRLRSSNQTPLLSVLLEGPPGCGKTAIAASIALEGGYPFIKIISPDQMVGQSEQQRCNQIAKVFDDAGKSPLSVIILDNIERLIDFVPIGARFSNALLQTLMVLVSRIPENPARKILVIATTSRYSILEEMGFDESFNVILTVPALTQETEVKKILMGLAMSALNPPEKEKSSSSSSSSRNPSQTKKSPLDSNPSGSSKPLVKPTAKQEEEISNIARACTFPLSMKKLMMVVEIAATSPDTLDSASLARGVPVGDGVLLVERFAPCLQDATFAGNSKGTSQF